MFKKLGPRAQYAHLLGVLPSTVGVCHVSLPPGFLHAGGRV